MITPQGELSWRAMYHDGQGKLTGESFVQHDGDKENKYADIDRWRLGRFDLLNAQGQIVFSLVIRKDQNLIYRRRTIRPLMGGTVDDIKVVYLCGWRQTVTTPKGQKNIMSIAYIYPDGSIQLDGAKDNLELLPDER